MIEMPDVPVRRDVKGMTNLLDDLKPGDRLKVVFKTEKYGVFAVRGPAIYSKTVSTFMVGSLFIESGLKPDKAVQSIAPWRGSEELDVAASETALWGVDEQEELQGAIDDLGHGDLVRATFERQPHGKFSIEGVLVVAEDNDIRVVGSWFVMFAGKPGLALRAIELRARAGTHGYPIPDVITSWETGEDALP